MLQILAFISLFEICAGGKGEEEEERIINYLLTNFRCRCRCQIMKCIKNYKRDFGWKFPSKVMILNLSPLQSKALFTFEFIGLGRVLSNLEIPFEALIVIE